MRKLPMFVEGGPFPQCHTAGCKILATCDPKWLHMCICVLLYQYFCDYGGEEVLQFGEDVADGLSGTRLLWQCFKDMRYNNRMEFVVRLTGFIALAGRIGQRSIWCTKKSDHWWEQVAIRKCGRELSTLRQLFFLLRTVIKWTFVYVFYPEVLCWHSSQFLPVHTIVISREIPGNFWLICSHYKNTHGNFPGNDVFPGNN